LATPGRRSHWSTRWSRRFRLSPHCPRAQIYCISLDLRFLTHACQTFLAGIQAPRFFSAWRASSNQHDCNQGQSLSQILSLACLRFLFLWLEQLIRWSDFVNVIREINESVTRSVSESNILNFRKATISIQDGPAWTVGTCSLQVLMRDKEKQFLHTAAYDATLYRDILQTDNGSQYLMIIVIHL